jgi:type IV pilus assembly protein PilC
MNSVIVKQARSIVPEYAVKYADARGQVRQQTAEAGSEEELRGKLQQQGYLVYDIKARNVLSSLPGLGRGNRLNHEKFLIMNQQLVTLIRAGLPILKALDLLGERLTDAKLSPYINNIRELIKGGAMLSDAFARQGIFPPMYVTSLMAGEKSGALVEVLDRYITYQRMALSVRKKLMLSLIYPCILLVLSLLLVVVLVSYVVPKFGQLYSGMNASLPAPTIVLIAVADVAQNYVLLFGAGLVAVVMGFRLWARSNAAKERIDRTILRTPLVGEVWIKFQVAQFCRVLSTLLLGGIPLVQAMETAGESVNSQLIRKALTTARQSIREGNPLSSSLDAAKVFPELAIDMMQVGESTGALPAMLGSVAVFYEEDVETRLGAILPAIEHGIIIVMGVFVFGILVSLYLPIFSLADTLQG